LNATPLKIPMSFFTNIDKSIIKWYGNIKNPNNKAILSKNNRTKLQNTL
jgi:CRISPR/Cas system CSM-associated protein Csm5 (group 7 of RAMP superfamily)